MRSRRGYLVGTAVALAGCAGGGTDPEPPADVTGSWTHLNGGTAGGTRATGTEPFEIAPAEAWTTDLGESGRLLLDGEVLYTNAREAFSRRSLVDGSVTWTLEFDAFVRLVAAVEDRVYAATGDSDPVVHAFGVPGGAAPAEEWTLEGIRAARADADILVGETNDNSRLFAYDPDGTERWSITAQEIAEQAVDGFGPIVLGEEHVFAVAERFPETGWVAGLDRADGTIRWSAQDPNQNTVLAASPDVVVSAGNESGVTGFDPMGAELWQVETDARVESAAIAGDRVLLTDRTSGVTAYTTRGDELWSQANARVLAVDRRFAYAAGDGLIAYSLDDGTRQWQLEATPEVVVPATGGLFGIESVSPQDVRLRLFQ